MNKNLYEEASNGNCQTQKLLQGADVNVIDATGSKGWTPLMVAAQKGHLGVAKLLINHKAWVNLKTEDGRNALHVAVIHDQVLLAELLLENGSYVDSTDNTGLTPLIYAACFMLIPLQKTGLPR